MDYGLFDGEGEEEEEEVAGAESVNAFGRNTVKKSNKRTPAGLEVKLWW